MMKKFTSAILTLLLSGNSLYATPISKAELTLMSPTQLNEVLEKPDLDDLTKINACKSLVNQHSDIPKATEILLKLAETAPNEKIRAKTFNTLKTLQENGAFVESQHPRLEAVLEKEQNEGQDDESWLKSIYIIHDMNESTRNFRIEKIWKIIEKSHNQIARIKALDLFYQEIKHTHERHAEFLPKAIPNILDIIQKTQDNKEELKTNISAKKLFIACTNNAKDQAQRTVFLAELKNLPTTHPDVPAAIWGFLNYFDFYFIPGNEGKGDKPNAASFTTLWSYAASAPKLDMRSKALQILDNLTEHMQESDFERLINLTLACVESEGKRGYKYSIGFQTVRSWHHGAIALKQAPQHDQHIKKIDDFILTLLRTAKNPTIKDQALDLMWNDRKLQNIHYPELINIMIVMAKNSYQSESIRLSLIRTLVGPCVTPSEIEELKSCMMYLAQHASDNRPARGEAIDFLWTNPADREKYRTELTHILLSRMRSSNELRQNWAIILLQQDKQASAAYYEEILQNSLKILSVTKDEYVRKIIFTRLWNNTAIMNRHGDDLIKRCETLAFEDKKEYAVTLLLQNPLTKAKYAQKIAALEWDKINVESDPERQARLAIAALHDDTFCPHLSDQLVPLLLNLCNNTVNPSTLPVFLDSWTQLDHTAANAQKIAAYFKSLKLAEFPDDIFSFAKRTIHDFIQKNPQHQNALIPFVYDQHLIFDARERGTKPLITAQDFLFSLCGNPVFTQAVITFLSDRVTTLPERTFRPALFELRHRNRGESNPHHPAFFRLATQRFAHEINVDPKFPQNAEVFYTVLKERFKMHDLDGNIIADAFLAKLNTPALREALSQDALKFMMRAYLHFGEKLRVFFDLYMEKCWAHYTELDKSTKLTHFTNLVGPDHPVVQELLWTNARASGNWSAASCHADLLQKLKTPAKHPLSRLNVNLADGNTHRDLDFAFNDSALAYMPVSQKNVADLDDLRTLDPKDADGYAHFFITPFTEESLMFQALIKRYKFTGDTGKRKYADFKQDLAQCKPGQNLAIWDHYQTESLPLVSAETQHVEEWIERLKDVENPYVTEKELLSRFKKSRQDLATLLDRMCETTHPFGHHLKDLKTDDAALLMRGVLGTIVDLEKDIDHKDKKNRSKLGETLCKALHIILALQHPDSFIKDLSDLCRAYDIGLPANKFGNNVTDAKINELIEMLKADDASLYGTLPDVQTKMHDMVARKPFKDMLNDPADEHGVMLRELMEFYVTYHKPAGLMRLVYAALEAPLDEAVKSTYKSTFIDQDVTMTWENLKKIISREVATLKRQCLYAVHQRLFERQHATDPHTMAYLEGLLGEAIGLRPKNQKPKFDSIRTPYHSTQLIDLSLNQALELFHAEFTPKLVIDHLNKMLARNQIAVLDSKGVNLIWSLISEGAKAEIAALNQKPTPSNDDDDDVDDKITVDPALVDVDELLYGDKRGEATDLAWALLLKRLGVFDLVR